MVLLHLQTGTSTDQKVDLWSWRTASAVSSAAGAGGDGGMGSGRDGAMRLLLASMAGRQLRSRRFSRLRLGSPGTFRGR